MQNPYDIAKPEHRAEQPAASACLVKVRRVKGTVVVSVRGKLDDRGSQQLRRVLTDLVENQGNLDVEVDLAGVTVLEPSGLVVLVEVANEAGGRGGRLMVRTSTDAVVTSSEKGKEDDPSASRRLRAMAWHPAAGAPGSTPGSTAPTRRGTEG